MTSLRRFVVWATDSRYHYTNNLFFRTTVHVVLAQMALAVLLVGAFAVALFYMSRELVSTVILHMITMLQDNVSADPLALSQSVSSIQTNTIIFIFFGIVVLTALFGIFLAYITLRPARNSLQQQKQFISNVAHELRTPLSTIKTTIEVMMLSSNLEQATRDTLNEVNEEIDRISQIVNNLLSLNQLLRPERIEFEHVDMGHIIDSVVGHLQQLADANKVTISVSKAGEGIVWGNTSALEQVVTNIVRNSITYMDPNRAGTITLTLQTDITDTVTLVVADNGIGIAQQDLLHIFEPFYRANSSRARTPYMTNKGSGLGLAIVSEIVRIHHGKIRMQSTPHKGTKTILQLPADSHSRAESVAPPARDDLYEVSMDFSKEHSPRPYFDQSPRKES